MLTDEERAAARELCNEAPDVIETADIGRPYMAYDQPTPESKAFYNAARSLLPRAIDDLALLHGRCAGLGAVIDLRGETIARLETENQRLSDALREVESSATDRSRRLSAERDEAVAKLTTLERALRALRSDCLATYGGGYRTEADRDVFRHGMETVCNAVDAALRGAGQEKGDD